MSLTVAQLDAAASAIAGKPTTVVCRSFATMPPSVTGYVLPDEAGNIVATIYLPQRTCRVLFRLDRKRHPLRSNYTTFDATSRQMDEVDGAAIETFAHESYHVGLNSFDESEVECRSYEHRRLELRAFVAAGARFPQWLVPQILLGMRWMHEHLADEYQLDC